MSASLAAIESPKEKECAERSRTTANFPTVECVGDDLDAMRLSHSISYAFHQLHRRETGESTLHPGTLFLHAHAPYCACKDKIGLVFSRRSWYILRREKS